MTTRYFSKHDLRVALDLRSQVLHLEIDPSASWREVMRSPSSKQRSEEGIEVIDIRADEPFASPLYPSVAALAEEGAFVSAWALALKAKAVDDGVVAALETLVDEGRDGVPGRAELLRGLQSRLRDAWDQSPEDASLADAIGLLLAALSLGGDEDDVDDERGPTPLRLRKSRQLREARQEQEQDVPLGVYSWDARLAGLYRQGKMLQRPLPDEVASALARTLRSDEALRRAYEAQLALAALTNPLAGPDVLSGSIPECAGASGRGPALFPPSESPEGALVKRLVGSNPVPPGFDLIGELIARVEDGRLSLAARGESGWYDHVLQALEPLIIPDQTPEAAKLRFGDAYRDDLKLLFRSLLGTARESHVKQIEWPVAGGCPFIIAPHLSFEPLAEHYRRRALSYRFVREQLVALMGEDVLLSRNRWTPRGETGGPLLDELIAMEQLYAGAWAIVLDELGIDLDIEEGERRWVLAGKAAARAWSASYREDPDLREDVRMMVPLFKDVERGEFHVLAVVGLEQRNLKVSFVERPRATVRDQRGCPVDPSIVWDSATYPLPRPVTIACRARRLLTRDEFRGLCDRAGSVEAIRSAMEA